jgi:hypothetical protein
MDVHVDNSNGTPESLHGVPLIIRIRLASEPAVRLAPGPPTRLHKELRRALPRWSRARRAIERLADRVTGWQGVFYEGEPVECTRSMLIIFLEGNPGICKSLTSAIKTLDNPGAK